MPIQIKRIYEPPDPADGFRVLVDRLWPRGVSRDAAAVDLWLRDLAPSTELRRWFNHDPSRWTEFQERYRLEIETHLEPVAYLRSRARAGTVTLLFASREETWNNAHALRLYLESEG